MKINDYFKQMDINMRKTYSVAVDARKKGYDPEKKVEIFLAKNLAERVVGMISVVAPQIQNSGVENRVAELEKKHGVLDWRVALLLSKDVAKEKFCKFKDKREAIEVGIRTGFAYLTLGVVSSPLEGFTSLEIKKRFDGKGEYFCVNYAGPIRNAGGTAAAVSVLIADYLRKELGYSKYDPTEEEIKRCYVEIRDYHERVTNLQYFPSQAETVFLMKNIPVEISGDESEKFEVSQYKNLSRIHQNRLRSGYCLIHSSCIPLKAPKLWKQLSKWGEDLNLEQWSFLETFNKLQKTMQAKSKKEITSKISPNYTYLKDLPAGRPVLSYPLRTGGFRLRFGRSRLSGFSAQGIHPATMQVLDGFLASATQLKVERPGKATSLTVCDSISGPIVKLKNGSVVFLETEKLAKQHKKEIKEILFLGDLLINYGDFLNRAHNLVSPGYCQEWWSLHLEQQAINLFGTIDYEKLSELLDISINNIEKILSNPLRTKLSAQAALKLSKLLKMPLHPDFVPFWTSISPNELVKLMGWLKNGVEHENKLIINISEQKKLLERIGLSHKVIQKEKVVIEEKFAIPLLEMLGVKTVSDLKNKFLNLSKKDLSEFKTAQELIENISTVLVKDKAGVFIGARMARPEKAKMRKMKGTPHTLFPVATAGGRMRSIQAALEKGKIKTKLALFKCANCEKETLYGRCEVCDKKSKRVYFCENCGEQNTEECKIHGKNSKAKFFEINIKQHMDAVLKKLGVRIYPDLIKGIRGMFSDDPLSEHLIKGILRAKNEVYVNKDGTIRYDASEVPITHFKPVEISTDVTKLNELGYEKDIHNKPLVNSEQVLELKPQDIILPAAINTPDEAADDVLFRTTKFVDECLVSLYGLKPFYNLSSKKDLIGHQVIGLAPHTSAGALARIIGVSRTQGFFAHPLFHAAIRRDCDGDEAGIILLLDAFLNFSKKYLPNRRGSTMDAPIVLTSILNPAEVDDMIFDLDVAKSYPLNFYDACERFEQPWNVSIGVVGDYLGGPKQSEGYRFTHPVTDMNSGISCSAYKSLPTMKDKLKGQMFLAEKIQAVEESGVAKLVIEKHFLRDIKGNLRGFSAQQFRCVVCNKKFSRPPLAGKCVCDGKLIFTISEGSVLKYLEPSIDLAKKYEVGAYLQQTLQLTKERTEGVFGRDKEKQTGLKGWF